MNNKELKRILKERADRTEIKDCKDAVLSSVNHRVRPKTDNTSKRKTALRFIPVAFFAAACALVAVILPISLRDRGLGDSLVVTKVQQVFSYEMLALGNAVQNPEPESSLASSLRRGPKAVTNYEKIASDVNGYLLTCDALTAKESIGIKYEYNKDSAYPRYKYKLTIMYNESETFKVSYTAYYSETESDGKEVEIVGVLSMGGGEFYPMEGKREDDGDEVKMELEVEMGKDSSIKISNETAADENDYEYEYKQNGIVVKGVSVDVEYDGNEKSMDIEIIENDVKTVYEFIFEGGEIECKYKADETFEIRIHTFDDCYLYEFEDGTEVRLPKV